jgi:hypothetical protein
MTTIPLGRPLLAGSSNLPGSLGRAARYPTRRRLHAVDGRFPIWSCSVRGFACHTPCSVRGALLPHLFTIACSRERERQLCVFCATVLRVAPTGRYPAHCSLEFGLSSSPTRLAARQQTRSSVVLRRNVKERKNPNNCVAQYCSAEPGWRSLRRAGFDRAEPHQLASQRARAGQDPIGRAREALRESNFGQTSFERRVRTGAEPQRRADD